jgi:putative transposase
MNELYRSIGISKQAVHQQAMRQSKLEAQMIILVREAEDLRREHPGCGLEKMYHTLAPDFIGRDRFIEFFMRLGFGVKHKKAYHRTTYAGSHYYPNLITGMLINGPSQIWQSDITYIRLGDRHYYAVFIVDVYTKKIVGYKVSDHMRATANVEALKMALKRHPAPIIHHSDRGSQYIYDSYVSLLERHNCAISMGLIAQDNAYAERVNGTIKNEYLAYWKAENFDQLCKNVSKAVRHYNTKRQHASIKRKTPIAFENEVLALCQHNRPMATIYAEGQQKMVWASSPPPFLAQQALLAPNCPIVKFNREEK